MYMKYLIFLCLVGGVLFSCSTINEGEFDLKRTTYFNLINNTFEYQGLMDNSLWGFRNVCDEHAYRYNNGDSYWVCEMLDDLEKIRPVFDSYQRQISETESLAAYYLNVKVHKSDLWVDLKEFSPTLLSENVTNTEVIRSLQKTVNYMDDFYDSLTEMLIDVFQVDDPLVLYDIALRHKRRESWKKVDSIYPDLPVHVEDNSIFREVYRFGTELDYSKMMKGVKTQYDYFLFLANLKFELSRLCYKVFLHRKYKVSYCGPTSQFLKSDIIVEGPVVVGPNEKFALQPRMSLYDPYMKYEVEYGDVGEVDSFRITKDTVIKGEVVFKKVNGVLVRYAFERKVYVKE